MLTKEWNKATGRPVKASDARGGATDVTVGHWPPVPEYVVDGLVDLLYSLDERVCRPPRQAAKVLAFVVQLYLAKQPFPTRKAAAQHLGVSIPTVDAVLSAQIAKGELTVEHKYIEGNVKQRAGSIKEKYVIPSQALVDVFAHYYSPDTLSRF